MLHAENANLEQQVSILLADNAALKSELATLKPEIVVDLDHETGDIVAQLDQNGFRISTRLSNLEAYSVDDQVLMIATELSEIYIQLVRDKIKSRVEAINKNRTSQSKAAKW